MCVDRTWASANMDAGAAGTQPQHGLGKSDDFQRQLAGSTGGRIIVFSHRLEGTTLYLTGQLDAYNAPMLHQVFDQFTSGDVTINLAEVSFLSSATLVELLQLSRRLTSTGGKLILAAPNPEIRSVFEVTGFDRIFTITS